MNASLAQLVRSLTANQEVLGSQARSQDFSWGGGGGGAYVKNRDQRIHFWTIHYGCSEDT